MSLCCLLEGPLQWNLEEAVEAALTINPKVAIPMHRSKADPLQFKNQVEASSSVRVAPLQIGEVYRFE